MDSGLELKRVCGIDQISARTKKLIVEVDLGIDWCNAVLDMHWARRLGWWNGRRGARSFGRRKRLYCGHTGGWGTHGVGVHKIDRLRRANLPGWVHHIHRLRCGLLE
jgi:hypothetical protein